MTTGEEIRMFRKELGLTQEELAELLGITRQYLCQLENGKYEAGEGTRRLLMELGFIEPTNNTAGIPDHQIKYIWS